MKFDQSKTVPQEVADMAISLGRWMEMNDATSIYGIGPVFPLQRQLAEVTRERDAALAAFGELQATAAQVLDAADALVKERNHYEAVCALADALRNKEKGL